MQVETLEEVFEYINTLKDKEFFVEVNLEYKGIKKESSSSTE